MGSSAGITEQHNTVGVHSQSTYAMKCDGALQNIWLPTVPEWPGQSQNGPLASVSQMEPLFHNTKPPTKFKVSSSSSFGDMFDCMPKIVRSHDLGHAHFQGKLFVRPLGKLHTKFEVCSSSSF